MWLFHPSSFSMPHTRLIILNLNAIMLFVGAKNAINLSDPIQLATLQSSPRYQLHLFYNLQQWLLVLILNKETQQVDNNNLIGQQMRFAVRNSTLKTYILCTTEVLKDDTFYMSMNCLYKWIGRVIPRIEHQKTIICTRFKNEVNYWNVLSWGGLMKCVEDW